MNNNNSKDVHNDDIDNESKPNTVTYVTKSNFHEVYPIFDSLLKQSSFIGVDTEFSGLGSLKNTKIVNIQERYHVVSQDIRHRSILELGISIYINTTHNGNHHVDESDNNDEDNQDNESRNNTYKNTSTINNKRKIEDTVDPKQIVYDIHIFNFIMLNTNDFQIAPHSITFLIKHGFDFNRLFLDGIPFTPKKTIPHKPTTSNSSHHHNQKGHNSQHHNTTTTNNKTNSNNNNSNSNINNEHHEYTDLILKSISSGHKPIIVHNGFFDIMFLYQTFVGELPDQLPQFISKFIEHFPIIFDTKFISDVKLQENSSYLQYLYMKSERKNFKRISNDKFYLQCNKKSLDSLHTVPLNNTLYSQSKPYNNTPICDVFAGTGYCKFGDDCPKSHDINIILDKEECSVKPPATATTPGSPSHPKESGTIIGGPPKPPQPVASISTNETVDTITPVGTTISHSKETKKMKLDHSNNKSPKKSEELKHKGDSSSTSNNSSSSNTNSENTMHSAGFDSALTGFIYAYYLLIVKKDKWVDLENKIFLTGKQVPLLLKKSNYVDSK